MVSEKYSEENKTLSILKLLYLNTRVVHKSVKSTSINQLKRILMFNVLSLES